MIKLRCLLLLGLVGLLLLGAGCQTRTPDLEQTSVARFLIESDSTKGAIQVMLPISGVSMRVAPKPVITEFDIRQVVEAEVEMGRCVLFQLSPAASRDLYRLTASNIGRRLVVVINGKPLGARLLDRPLEAGTLFIFLEVADESLPAMVKNLNATTVKIQEEVERRG